MFSGGRGVLFELFDEALELADVPSAVNATNSSVLQSLYWIEHNDPHDHYATRMTGFFVPPKTGNYSFYVRSDDSSELWFNIDGVGSNLVSIL